jgi:hypothetical protein
MILTVKKMKLLLKDEPDDWIIVFKHLGKRISGEIYIKPPNHKV